MFKKNKLIGKNKTQVESSIDSKPPESSRNSPDANSLITLPNNIQPVTEVDVPDNGSCLFYSVAFSVLLSKLDNPGVFQNTFARLYGQGAAEAENNFKQLLLSYNGSKSFINEQGAALKVLVDICFRNQVVQYVNTYEKHLMEEFSTTITGIDLVQWMKTMSRPKSWGDEIAICAMASLLQHQIIVYQTNSEGHLEERARYPLNVRSDSQGTVYLHHVNAIDKKDTTNRNHYHYFISPSLIPQRPENITTTLEKQLKLQTSQIPAEIIHLNEWTTQKALTSKAPISYPNEVVEILQTLLGTNGQKAIELLTIYLIHGEDEIKNSIKPVLLDIAANCYKGPLPQAKLGLLASLASCCYVEHKDLLEHLLDGYKAIIQKDINKDKPYIYLSLMLAIQKVPTPDSFNPTQLSSIFTTLVDNVPKSEFDKNSDSESLLAKLSVLYTLLGAMASHQVTPYGYGKHSKEEIVNLKKELKSRLSSIKKHTHNPYIKATCDSLLQLYIRVEKGDVSLKHISYKKLKAAGLSLTYLGFAGLEVTAIVMTQGIFGSLIPSAATHIAQSAKHGYKALPDDLTKIFAKTKIETWFEEAHTLQEKIHCLVEIKHLDALALLLSSVAISNTDKHTVLSLICYLNECIQQQTIYEKEPSKAEHSFVNQLIEWYDTQYQKHESTRDKSKTSKAIQLAVLHGLHILSEIYQKDDSDFHDTIDDYRQEYEENHNKSYQDNLSIIKPLIFSIETTKQTESKPTASNLLKRVWNKHHSSDSELLTGALILKQTSLQQKAQTCPEKTLIDLQSKIHKLKTQLTSTNPDLAKLSFFGIALLPWVFQRLETYTTSNKPTTNPTRKQSTFTAKKGNIIKAKVFVRSNDVERSAKAANKLKHTKLQQKAFEHDSKEDKTFTAEEGNIYETVTMLDEHKQTLGPDYNPAKTSIPSTTKRTTENIPVKEDQASINDSKDEQDHEQPKKNIAQE